MPIESILVQSKFTDKNYFTLSEILARYMFTIKARIKSKYRACPVSE